MTPEELKARARRIAQELLTQGDLAIAGEVFAPGCMHHLPIGCTGTMGWVSTLRRAFPDLCAIVEDELAEGTTVAQCLTLAGTHDGPFMGNPPTGRRASWQMAVILRADHTGVFTAHWSVWDQLDLLHQLGAAPPLAALPP